MLFLVTCALLAHVQGADLCVAGGLYNATTSVNTVYCHNKGNNSWYTLSHLPTEGNQIGLISYKGALTRVAGKNNTLFSNFLEIWNGTSWTPRTLAMSRSSPGVAIEPGANVLYIAGGYTSVGTSTDFVEIWNGTAPTPAPNMNASRAIFTLTYWPAHGVCATGGANTGGETLASWECWDSVKWFKQLSSMQSQRRSHSAIYLPAPVDRLCVAGGSNGAAVLSSVECTTPSLLWEYFFMVSLPSARRDFVWIQYGSDLCAIGGWAVAPATPLNNTECLSNSSLNGSWSQSVLPALPSPRHSHGAALWDAPTMAPTTAQPTTPQPTTMQPTLSPTRVPTTQSPTTSSPTTRGPTRSPTGSPTTRGPVTAGPTAAPTTLVPTRAPTPGACEVAPVPAYATGQCAASPHDATCTNHTCSFGVASGSAVRTCHDGVWSSLTCNSYSKAETNLQLFNAFAVNSWEGIVSLTSIALVFILCVSLIIVGCLRARKKRHAKDMLVAMTALPAYSETAPDYVFPDQVASAPAVDPDPFAAEKATAAQNAATMESERAAAEKVRNDQILAYQAAAGKDKAEENKHGEASG